ncbi:hypothetical protein ACJIZ3_019675 [Penstemon smallii]|uniref:Protein kinase domain-containing protein n=1 Tax=Penstemon smallii TaxID=265156 RepID=A0ABD3T2I5_9LAMI
MAFPILLLFFFVFHFINPKSAYSKCHKPFRCGNLGTLEFPLSNYMQPECGLFMVNCSSSSIPKIQFNSGGIWYEIHLKFSTNKLVIIDPFLKDQLSNKNLLFLRNMSLPKSSSISLTLISPNITLFKCNNEPHNEEIQQYFDRYNYENKTCPSYTVYYRNPRNVSLTNEIDVPSQCSVIQMPVNLDQLDSGDLFRLLTAEFIIEWNVYDNCSKCYNGGGLCTDDEMNSFHCKTGKSRRTLIIAAAGGGLFLLCLVIPFIIWQHKKRKNSAYLISRNISSEPSSKSDIECGSFYYGIPIFSYSELEKVTNNFDSSKELGDGGFGTVYYGKLKDGREVAIKRLYEHNCKRVEQFMNEIQILTCLKHKNLVNLYGCTSRRSRELLLVYEYIPNGTVADHLHGERAKEAPLTWHVRLNIAIETASALAYLHKSDIVHRDVKTNNILLDNNFCVKVADFGLSRLFPNDVTHISTAPQGTPGYVDPEYHQCYQLTDKSDVYSFGVVLIELVSSKPAVDINRHRHEINLANMAVNLIQRCAFDELIDSSLGYKSDSEITRMTTMVAELAFRCLQLEKDMRPSMDEVLDFLVEIQNGVGSENQAKIQVSPENDDAVLLKNKYFQSSPNAVTDKWASGSTTTSSIG